MVKVVTDFSGVNLGTGEKTRHIVGEGQRVEECWTHRRLGPPPWYPYSSQEEADKARDEFVRSLVKKIELERARGGNMDEIRTGDVVELKSGSPWLTVLDVRGENAEVGWIADGVNHNATFPKVCLKKKEDKL